MVYWGCVVIDYSLFHNITDDKMYWLKIWKMDNMTNKIERT